MSEKIRRLVAGEIKVSGLSQREVARRAGITHTQVSRYLAGRTEIQTDTLDRLLAVFGKELKAVKRSLSD